MDIIIINKEDSEFYERDELAMVKTALLFARKVFVVNYNFQDLVFYCNFDKMSFRKVIAYYLDTIVNSNLEDKDKLYTEGLEMYKEWKNLKGFKYKKKEPIVEMMLRQRNLNDFKIETLKRDGEMLEEEYKMPLMKFYQEKVLHISIHNPAVDKKTKTIPEELIAAFLNDEVIQFFDEFVFANNPNTLTNDVDILSVPLFFLPELNMLSYDQMKLIRYQMQDTLNPFYDAVKVMQKEFSNVLYNTKNQSFITSRTTEILGDHCTLIKDTLENNIYIQQIKNSLDEYLEYELNFCVSSIEKVVGFYLESKIIDDDEATDILRHIAIHKPLETCCFFFFNNSVKKEMRLDTEEETVTSL